MRNEEVLVLLSKHIFPATGEAPFAGFVAIQGADIIAIGNEEQAPEWSAKAARVIDLGDKVITPGYCDVHTFFSGWVLRSLGIDFSPYQSAEAGIKASRQTTLWTLSESRFFKG